MPAEPAGSNSPTPTTVADLHLPPSFVADHCIRTLSYQGPMTVADIAKHWRIHDAVVFEVLESLRAAGLVQVDSAQANYERLSRMRLTDSGQARVTLARQRTWYAGVLPVSVTDFNRRMAEGSTPRVSAQRLRAALSAISIDTAVADELGQAVGAGATIAISGAAPDEQAVIARAIASALEDPIALPYALFTAGSVIRVYDPRVHRTREERDGSDSETDVLRSHTGESQWLMTPRPLVMLSGGLLPSDVVPAYDEEARFYVAPPPLAASGGVFAVLDTSTASQGFADFASLWLTPGRCGTGIVLLRSGERVEVPWSAATVLFCAAPNALRDGFATLAPYRLDVSGLEQGALGAYVTHRFRQRGLDEGHAAALASLLMACQASTRVSVTYAADYIAHRAAYEGASFALSTGALQAAVEFAARQEPPRERALKAA